MIRFLLKELKFKSATLTLLLTLFTATTAWAAEATTFPLSSGQTWTNTTTNTKYTVSGEAGNLTLTVSVADASKNEGKGSIADHAFANKNMSGVKSLVINEGITVIENGAFREIQCEVTSITFPSTLNSIEDYAFYNASSLNCAIDLSGCTQLASIGDNAFYKTSITSLSLPSSLTSIGGYAFSEVSSLGGAIDLSGCTHLTSIGEGTFYQTSITSLSLPSSLTSIGNIAFKDCYNLETVTIASGSQLQTIGSSTFNNCHFQSLVLPCAGLTSVGSGAFNRKNGYQNLSEIVCLTEANLSVNDVTFYDNRGQVTVYMLGSHRVGWGSRAKAVKGLVTSVEAGDNVSSLSADYSAAVTKTVNGTKYYVSGSTVKLTLTSSLTGDGVVLRANGEDLFMGDDGKYTLTLPDNATIVTVTASIPTNISGATVTLAENSYIYDGSAKTPAVSSVVLGTTTLTEGTDYTVSYSNNVNVGNAVVTVTGRNSYCGTVTVLVPIRGPEITGITYNEAGGYYEIPDTATLNTLAAYVNAGHSCVGHVFKLTNDISYDETIDNNFTPIGNAVSSFDGILDGDNHTISGVRMSVSGTKYNGVGLVGCLGGDGVVKNLHATRFTIVGTTNDNSVASCFIAAIVGGKAGGSITGCTVSNSSISGFKDIGGICGGQSSAFGSISNCTVTDCVITAEDSYAGGITGEHSYPISDCVVTGTTITTNGSYAGGIAGVSSNSVTNCRVADCTIENTYNELFYGVITGKRSNGSISNCVYQSSNPTIKGVGTDYDGSTHYVGSDGGCTRVYAVKCLNNAAVTLQSGTTETIGSGTYYHDGATLALSHSEVPDSYTFAGYDVKDVSDNDVDISENTFTITASDVVVKANWTVATSYIDADGTEQTAQAILLDNTMTSLEAGWYVVDSDVSYTGTVECHGDVYLILADGKTMTVNSSSIDIGGIYGYPTSPLTIYGQKLGTGALSVNSKKYGLLFNDPLVINGGTISVTATGDDEAIAVDHGGSIIFNGGKVETIGGKGFIAYEGDIILGWRNTTDRIKASSYKAGDNKKVCVANGKALSDGTNCYSGTLTAEQIAAIAGKTLVPAFAVKTADGIEQGTVASGQDYYAEGNTVTITVTPAEGYSIKTVSYNDGTADHELSATDGVYAFTMPASDVTVSVQWNQLILGVSATGYEGTFDGHAHSIKVTAPAGTTVKYGTAEGTYNLDAAPAYTDDGTYTVYYQVSMPDHVSVTGSAQVIINTSTIIDEHNSVVVDNETFYEPTASVHDAIYEHIHTDFTLSADAAIHTKVTDEGGLQFSAGEDVDVALIGEQAGDILKLDFTGHILVHGAKLRQKSAAATRGNETAELVSGAEYEILEAGNIVLTVSTHAEAVTLKGISVSAPQTTGIGGVKSEEVKSEEWYTLDGRRLTAKPTTPGLYIHSGKKVLVK